MRQCIQERMHGFPTIFLAVQETWEAGQLLLELPTKFSQARFAEILWGLTGVHLKLKVRFKVTALFTKLNSK